VSGAPGLPFVRLTLLAVLLTSGVVPAAEFPDRAFVEHVESRVASGEYVGLVVGLIDGDRTYIESFGTRSRASAAPPDARTLFEISSVAKTFVAAVLARSAVEGVLALDDPANRYLGPDAALADFERRSITLLDLAAHQSGLPYLPSSLAPGEDPNPYAATTEADLVSAINAFEPTEAPGSGYSYSAFAYGVLALVLERVRGDDVFQLIAEDVTGPLGMADTVLTPSRQQAERLATGYTPDGDEAAAFDQGAFRAAGSMYSTLDDVMTWLRANMRPGRSPLADALILTHRIQNAGGDIGLAWHRTEGFDDRSQYGTALGYRAYVGFLADGSRGVVILANTQVDAAALGARLLLGTKLPD